MGKGFFKENAKAVESILQLLDILFVLCSFLSAHYLRSGDFEMSTDQLLLVVSTLFGVHIVFTYSGLYQRWRGKTISAEIMALALNFALVLLMLGVFFFFSKTGQVYSRLWIFFAFSLSFFSTALARVIIRNIANWRRRNGYNTRSLLLVGAGDLGLRVAKTLRNNSWAGINVVGFVDDRLTEIVSNENDVEGRLRILGTVDQTPLIVEDFRKNGTPVDYVWVALPSAAKAKAEWVLDQLLDSTVSVCLVPDFFDVQLMKSRVDTIADIPLVNLTSSNIYGISGITKRIFDFLLASIMLFILSPVFLIVSVIVKLDSKGPVFFAQRRYGIDGKEIVVYKFRTMNVQEDGNVVKQVTKKDSRVTNVGAFLRRSSIDELPQFVNVLEGKMSLVGPRPHAVAHNEFYRTRIKGYMTRHVIRPGITGLAQVNGCRGETETEEKMNKRLEYDLTYINRWSLGLDLKIILLTVKTVLFPKNVY